MHKIVTTILLSICSLSLMAQMDAARMLDKTAERLEKDGSIFISLLAQTLFDGSSGNMELECKYAADGRFCATIDDTMLWFDGKTLWRGADYGSGIEEIYITTPTDQEKAIYNIPNMLRRHKGFVVGPCTNNSFTLTAESGSTESYGLIKIVVHIAPDTYTIQGMDLEFSQESDIQSATVKVTEYRAREKFAKETFICPVTKYPEAEIIDLR